MNDEREKMLNQEETSCDCADCEAMRRSLGYYAHNDKGQRVDPHRPSAINPGDYEYIQVGESRKARQQGEKLGGPAGTCHHCGKAIIWEVHFRHLPSDKIVTFGYQCAGILEMTDNRIDHEMNLLKRRAANERQEEEWKKQREDRHADFVANYPDEAAFVRDYQGEFGKDFINRLRWGIEKYGSPLDNQIESLKRFIAARQTYEDNKLAEAKLLENAPLLGEGRQHLVGTVVSTKVIETQFGSQEKMLVRLDDGNKVFGSIPRSLDNVEKDDRVAFDAAVEPKEDHYGYFSRPTKAVKL